MQRPQLVALVLAIGALAVVYNVWTYSQLFLSPNSTSMSEAVSEAEIEPASIDEEASPSVGHASSLTPAQLSAMLGGPNSARNPFQFVATTSAAGGEPVALPMLQGILRGRGRRVAWIDGRVYSEGEEIAGHRVLRIEADHVVLERAGQEHELRPRP